MSSLDDVASRVRELPFPVYRVAAWEGARRISHVMGTDAVSLVHTEPEPSRQWIEVQTRLVGHAPAASPEVEAEAALEEVLWDEQADAEPAHIVDADAEILSRVRQAPHRLVEIAVDHTGVELMLVGDTEAWAAWGRMGCVAVRISAKGVRPSAVALEHVHPGAL